MATERHVTPQVERPDFRPTGMKVLIKVDSGETKSPGGLLLPASNKGRPNTGTLIVCGPGEQTRKAFVTNPLLGLEGQRVVFDPYMLILVFGVDGMRSEASVAARGGEYALIDCDFVQGVCDENDRVQPGNA